jgi:signal transduction histidine kinase
MIELNLDLLSVGITTAGIALLGFTIYFNNPRSVTNASFLAFSLITIVWSIANYLQYQPSTPSWGLWTVRIITFFGVWHAFSFFILCYAFPDARVSFPRIFSFILLPIVALTSILTLTPLVFRRVTELSSTGVVTAIENGPAIALFGILSISLIVVGLAALLWKAPKRHGHERHQVIIMGLGTLLTFLCIVTFNIVLPAAFNNPRFLPLSAVFIFPFVACTAYAIARYKLFDVKVLATEVIAFFLCVATLLQIIFSSSAIELIFRTSVFGLVLTFSILMVRSVIKEVRQREIIEKQEKELEEANKQQESLLHFISHEVKGYLTKSEGAFAGIVSGDYGKPSEEIAQISTMALTDTRKGVATVMDILDASNLKRGTLAIARNPYDVAAELSGTVHDLETAARERGLALEYEQDSGSYAAQGDAEKLRRHVFRNLIDNSIHYTQKGSVHVHLSRTPHGYRITVSDTGVGITAEDMKRLFTEGGKGADSLKVNVHSTGYGLYIAKMIVEAHGGKIWAESAGAGKGSRFTIELPQ